MDTYRRQDRFFPSLLPVPTAFLHASLMILFIFQFDRKENYWLTIFPSDPSLTYRVPTSVKLWVCNDYFLL